MSQSMRIVGLHRLRFDADEFEREMEFAAGRSDEPQLRKQFRENRENAWIVVIEYSGVVDFGELSYPKPGPNAQAAWLEQELPAVGGMSRAAFFLHYVNPRESLFYQQQQLRFPEPSTAPEDLVELLGYQSPD